MPGSGFTATVTTVASRIAVIEGDGIGREVIPAAIGVIKRLGLDLDFEHLDVNAERFLATGEALPAGAFGELESADAILLGAIGDPRIRDPRYSGQSLGRIRRELDLYANVRPARLLDARLSPLRLPGAAQAGVTIIRENTEGLYGSLGGRFKPGTQDETALQEHISTYRGVRRILDYAFSAARSSVVMADKWSAMPHAGALWGRCWEEATAAHPAVPARRVAIDACALHMIRDPGQFDVVVTENSFGDILSDVAAALIGGVSFMPSANVNAASGRAMFEPVHGSAPDIAGSGTANPVAAVLACSLMLAHLGFPEEAAEVETATAAAVRAGECTPDGGGGLSTAEAAAAIARRLR